MGSNTHAGHGVVVGYDGSTAAQAAVRWAAEEAARRRVPLTVLEAVDLSSGFVDPMVAHADDWPGPLVQAGREIADEGAAVAREVAGDHAAVLDVRPLIAYGTPADVLLEASHTAELVVVGSRGRGDLASACLGSVSTAVASHASCPVVVIRGGHPAVPGPAYPVVVGVDGSEAADRAVEAAAALAAGAGTRLRVVSVWNDVGTRAWLSAYAAVMSPSARDVTVVGRLAAEEIAAKAAALARRARPGLPVSTLVVEGATVGSLVSASNDASVLVVGTRGHGAAAGLVLGSVSHGVAHRAHCPVMVVRVARRHRIPQQRRPVSASVDR